MMRKIFSNSIPCNPLWVVAILIGMSFLTACSKYQYVTISGQGHQNTQKEFVVDNDTVKINYSFSGDNCPVAIRIYNKLSQPIYVDWTKSVLVIEDKHINYFPDSLQKATYNKHDEIHWVTIPTPEDSLQAHSVIAAKSAIVATRISLRRSFFVLTLNDQIRSNLLDNGIAEDVHIFNHSASPLQFHSILKLSTDQNFSTTITREDSFWVSDIIESMEADAANGSANQFRLKASTGLGTAAAYIAGFGVVFLILLLAS